MNYNLINFCEIDMQAVNSYCSIHSEDNKKNIGDITKVDISKLSKCDIITHGSPCQSFSIAGLQEGGDEGSKTRSSLMWNSIEIISHCQPKFVIWENVRNVLSKKHKHNFDMYISKMNDLGYNSYYQVLNSKDYGIPQSRNRVFCISINKNIDIGFNFPTKINMRSILEFLDEEVADNYFKICPSMLRAVDRKKCRIISDNDYIDCITTKQDRAPNSGFYNSKQGWRYFTQKECMRLMGFEEKDYALMNKATSAKTIQYKQIGNSVVVDVIVEIYKSLAEQYPNDFIENLSLISLFSGIGAFEKAFSRVEVKYEM